MKNEIEKSKSVDEPIVIPDECGDNMWDTVLEQLAFVQALKQASKIKAADKNYSQS